MKLVPLLLISTVSLSSYENNWTFDRQGLTAFLSSSAVGEAPLRLTCAQKGYLEINILSGSKPEVTLAAPSKPSLTIRGELSADGRITSNVYFKSLTVEFLREEGDVDVFGSRTYRLHLNGARRVLETLEGACTAVS